MFTSWSEQSTPAELSMASVLIAPSVLRVFDPAKLRHAKVAAFGYYLAAQFRTVDAHGVIGAVAYLRVGLAR